MEFSRDCCWTCDWREVKGRCLFGKVIPVFGFHYLCCHFSVHPFFNSFTAKMGKLMTAKHVQIHTKPLVYSPRVLSPLSMLSLVSMPKSPLNLPPSPPACKDILSTLYLGGVPSVAERIISLLSPADLCSSQQVCTTWNHLVSSGAQFMDKVNNYHRQCKENAENLHKTEEPMEATLSPVKRIPLAAITPNTMSPFRTTNAASPTPFTAKCIKPWHEGESSGRVKPSKRPRQSEAICGTNKSKKRLRRL